MTADTTALAGLGRERLRALVEEHGEEFTGGIVVEINGPTGECWTNAWHAANEIEGRTYVEGLVILRGKIGTHGFTVDAAGTVYEHTKGFERAGGYVGIRVDISPGSEARKVSAKVFRQTPRCSLFEMALGAGVPPALALRNFGVRP